MKRSDFLKTAGLGMLAGPAALAQKRLSKGRELIIPKRLKPGDTVALTAPAGIVYDPEEFDRMREVLESFGFTVKFGEYVRRRYGYLAGNDHQRALDLMRFFLDPAVDGIVAVRGGWGCARIVPHLDFGQIRDHPKAYCGFSDNTTLHLALRAYSGMVSYHGPNGTSEWTDLTKESFKRVLIDGATARFEPSRKITTIASGEAEGVLIGGNLTILTTSLGTPWQPDTEGAILFAEDIGEEPYKIDRMMTHLKSAGILDGLNGFVFGRCTDCEEEDDPDAFGFTIREVLEQHLRPLGIPAVMGLDIGHDPGNITLPVGLRARMDAGSGVLQLLEQPALAE